MDDGNDVEGFNQPAITREAIRSGAIAELVKQQDPDFKMLSEHERQSTLDKTLAAWDGGDIWLFGYGSLIWNPAFHYVERRLGRIHGYHRQFCLWTPAGRGSPDFPGLMLALEHGGSCQGIAFRIAADQVCEELDIVWRREMIAGSYRPVWTTVHAAPSPVKAIAFVMDRTNHRYAGRLPDDQIVDTIAHAHGPIGRCADYLFSTVEHLAELGIDDHRLTHLAGLVRAKLKQNPA